MILDSLSKEKSFFKRQKKYFLTTALLTLSIFFGYVVFVTLQSLASPSIASLAALIVALVVYGLSTSQKKDKYEENADKEHIKNMVINADMEYKNNIIEIFGQCETLKNPMAENEKRRIIDSILNATTQLENYVKNLSATVNICSENINQVERHTNVKELITPVLERAKIFAKWNNQQLEYNFDRHLEESLASNNSHLKAILQNILHKNIMKGLNSDIQVSIKSARPSNGAEAIKILISITPNGKDVGEQYFIKPQNRYNDIFDFVTYNYLDQIGGESLSISLYKEEYIIPINEKKIKTAVNENEEISQHDSGAKKQSINQNESTNDLLADMGTVLIVDDHPANLMVLKKLVSSYKYKDIIEASSGSEAVELYRASKPEIIFMDCQMPNMNGFDASQQIRRMEQIQKLNKSIIIGVTADTSRATRKRAKECGMDQLVYKPISPKSINAALTKLIAADNFITGTIVTENIRLPASKVDITFTELTTDNMKASQMPVNLERLRSYTDGNIEEERIFFNIFIEQARETLNILEKTLKDHNEQAWCQAAHKLKGSSANLGAEQLAELCQIAEKHDGNLTDEDVLKAIRSELNKVDNFLTMVLTEDSKNNETAMIH